MISTTKVETYLAYPKDKSTVNAILVLTDAIGHRFINAQLIADQFAANGYFVVMPDLFHGDAAPLNRSSDFDFEKWHQGHGIERVSPAVEAALKEIKKAGAKKIGGVGYCFGAKYVVMYLKPGDLDAGFVAHPSYVEVDEMKAIQGPLSIAAAGMYMLCPSRCLFRSEVG
jgi:dienelactone hydrolase